MQQRLQRPRQMAALIAALVEFQKTQVFFMLTIEVAVVIALYYGTHVDATSRAQLWNNVIFMRYVGYSGLDPVVFGKLLLRKVGKLSRYVCVASACCVLVASVAVLKSLTAGVELEQVRHFIPRLDECAFEAPTQYCSRLRVGYLRVPRTVALVWWAVSPAIMLVLLLEKCDALYTPRLRSAIGKAAKWIAIGKSGRARDLRGSKAGYSRLALIFAEVWLVINMCMSIRSYAAFLPDTNTTAADGIWPLGQIIAVGVWIPGIVEFLYLLLQGIEKGSMYRLVRPYQVTGLGSPSSPTNASAQSIPLVAISTPYQSSATSSASSVDALLLPPPAPNSVEHARTWSPS